MAYAKQAKRLEVWVFGAEIDDSQAEKPECQHPLASGMTIIERTKTWATRDKLDWQLKWV